LNACFQPRDIRQYTTPMKFLFDLLPILLFFAVYKFQGIYAATGAAIAATALQVAWQWYRHRRVDKMLLVTLVLISALGGATILFHDRAFVMWKPTAIYWLFAAVLFGSQFIGGKPLMERMMAHVVEAPSAVWKRLNMLWGGFFIFLGVANLYVANRYFAAQRELDQAAGSSVEIANCAEQLTGNLLNLCENAVAMEAQWVNFKLFGLMGLMVLFVIAQAFYLARYMQPAAQTGETDNNGDR
jgi:intracellular septation protein